MLVTDVSNLVADANRSYQTGDFQGAARLFAEAAFAFQNQNLPLDAAEMKNNQSVALLQANDAPASFAAAQNTPEVFATAGDFRREGMAYGNLAMALSAMGRVDEAIGNYDKAANALEKAGEDQMRASVMQAMAGVQLKKGKIMQALVTMQIGLAGVKHPTLKQKILRGLLRFRSW